MRSRLGKYYEARSNKKVLQLPLTERVCFKTQLQRGNRVQVPKYVR